MNAQFITNQHKFLSEIINGILPKSIQADILVGYFYFSGFEQIYKKVEDKCVRVLVGLDIDTEIINRVREVDYHTEINQSRGQQKRDYYHSLVQLFNETDYFDSSEKTEAFTLFYHKIREGTLEIRKTKEPCHAKIYLFTYSDSVNEMGEEPGTVITGSSNLSRSGLKERLEINARFTNKAVYHEAKGIFDNLWKDAIIIADKEHIEEFDSNVIERIWIDKLYSPYTFYIRVLQEYFSLNFQGNFKNASDITGGKFFDLKYQSDAIKMALSTIETHSGVIVSDVVGLGKSIIGSAVAHNLNLKTIIVAPPHLVSQWDGYKSDFHFSATVFSSGSISKALEFYQHHKTFNEKWLIILDEAHKYRNEYTQDYADLHKLCKNNKVLLLTATPFNNKPQDIYSMIKLFQIPSHSTLQTVNNLGKEFRSLISQYAALTRREKNKKKRTADEIKKEADKIAARIRTIIEPLVIRRSRLDLEAISTYREDLKKQGIEFPRVAEPRLMEYSLGALKDLYLKTLNKLSPHTDEEGNPDTDAPYFKAARYQPVKYVKAARTEHLKKRIEEAGFEYNLFLYTPFHKDPGQMPESGLRP